MPIPALPYLRSYQLEPLPIFLTLITEYFQEEVCCAQRCAKLSPARRNRCENSSAGPNACCIGWQPADWVSVETTSVSGCAIAPRSGTVSSACPNCPTLPGHSEVAVPAVPRADLTR